MFCWRLVLDIPMDVKNGSLQDEKVMAFLKHTFLIICKQPWLFQKYRDSVIVFFFILSLEWLPLMSREPTILSIAERREKVSVHTSRVSRWSGKTRLNRISTYWFPFLSLEPSTQLLQLYFIDIFFFRSTSVGAYQMIASTYLWSRIMNTFVVTIFATLLAQIELF